MYSIFMKNNGWRGPKNLEQLKTFIDKQNEDQLLMMGIDPSNLDSIFIGEHDDQPLQIRWNLKSSMFAGLSYHNLKVGHYLPRTCLLDLPHE